MCRTTMCGYPLSWWAYYCATATDAGTSLKGFLLWMHTHFYRLVTKILMPKLAMTQRTECIHVICQYAVKSEFNYAMINIKLHISSTCLGDTLLNVTFLYVSHFRHPDWPTTLLHLSSISTYNQILKFCEAVWQNICIRLLKCSRSVKFVQEHPST
jgi:hypothetical protein